MNIRPGRYRHFKGGLYEVIGVASHSESREPLVVYRPLYGEGGLWVRPLAMFTETVERDGHLQPRFRPDPPEEPAMPQITLDADLAQRLQELLDKQAIMELLHTYCNAADRHDNDKMRSLYHEDAIDDHGSFFKGLAMEFIDRLPEIQAPMAILHHNVTTVNLRIDGNYGEGEVYILAFHKVRTDEGAFDLLIGGRYFDKYEKRNGIWKFSHRAVVADWANLHDPSIVNLDNPVIEGAFIGRPGEGDPSYGFFRLQQRGDRWDDIHPGRDRGAERP